MNTPTVMLYVQHADRYKGLPRVEVTDQVIDIWMAGVGGPYLSLSVNDWRAVAAAVEDAIADAHVAQSRQAVEETAQ